MTPEGGNIIALIAGPGKPPRSMQGLGLPYLAAVLEEAGFEAKIFDLYPPLPDTEDLMVLDQRLADVITQEQPSIVGITIHTPDYVERVRLAKFIRERLPHVLLIAGGHHPSAEPEHLLRNSDFDICIIGEGEKTLLEIARGAAQGNGRNVTDWLRDVQGMVYKNGNEVIINQPRPFIEDLDSLPFLAHHLLGLENYSPHPNLCIKSTGIITYRGCPMGCTFCCNPQGSKIRERSPLKVVDEMTEVVKKFGIQGFNFHDNLFGLNRKHTMTVCDEIIQRKMDVVWDCWTSGDLIDAELADKMKAAGCVRVGFGAESADDEVLIKAKRGFTAAQHRVGIHTLKSAGLKVEAFFMIGLPGESEKSIQLTVEFAKQCGADNIVLSLVRPWPGSAIWNNPETFNVKITHGPNFEAYIETKNLSRAAMFECARRADDELKQSGLKSDFLRIDRYAWE